MKLKLQNLENVSRYVQRVVNDSAIATSKSICKTVVGISVCGERLEMDWRINQLLRLKFD